MQVLDEIIQLGVNVAKRALGLLQVVLDLAEEIAQFLENFGEGRFCHAKS